MVDKKNIKKLSRKDLVEILLMQSKKIDELEEELVIKNKLINEREIKINECGSIAEASIKLNNLFIDADKAVKEYKDNIIKLQEDLKNKIEDLNKKQSGGKKNAKTKKEVGTSKTRRTRARTKKN